MKETLIRRWAHAPWHSWLKEEPEWLDLFAELWIRMPESALRKIFLTTRTLVVLPPVHYGRVVRIVEPFLRGVYILQLDKELLSRPRSEALGILAHEMAHLCTHAYHEDELKNDLEADRLTVEWGFGTELLQALKRDLDQKHPRVTHAESIQNSNTEKQVA